MKIEFQRESFLQSFAVAGSVAPSKSTKPVLENVCLEATPSHTVLTATSTDVAMRLEVTDVTVHQPGVALLPVSRVLPWLRESNEERLTIEVDRDRILLKGRYAKVSLQARDPEEFPPVASFEESAYVRIAASVLRRLVRRTVFATDNESSRFALGGVLLEAVDDQLIAVATDGRRLARMQGAIERIGASPAGETMTIVPTMAMQLLEKSLPDDETPVDVATRSNDILVRCGRTVLYSRLVEGRFPRWRDVFPHDRPQAKRIHLTVGPLVSAIRQAVVVADTESRGVDFEFREGTMRLTLNCANIGESVVELPVDYADEPMEISLDYRFFMDFLKVLGPEQMFTMEIESAERAALCTTEDGYGYVIMPLSRDRR